METAGAKHQKPACMRCVDPTRLQNYAEMFLLRVQVLHNVFIFYSSTQVSEPSEEILIHLLTFQKIEFAFLHSPG